MDINPIEKSMKVEGLHLAKYTTQELKIYVDSILSSSVIDGSYFKTDVRLKNDIQENPFKYQSLFHHASNLKILNYLADCNKLDNTHLENTEDRQALFHHPIHSENILH